MLLQLKRILTHLRFEKRISWQHISNISGWFETTIHHQKNPTSWLFLLPLTFFPGGILLDPPVNGVDAPCGQWGSFVND